MTEAWMRFQIDIDEGPFNYCGKHDAIEREAALDGMYAILTSVPAEKMISEEAVLYYRSLSRAERAFRTLKSVDLKIRPIHHWTEERVRSHIFLCMLAYYVEWHLREAWKPLLYPLSYGARILLVISKYSTGVRSVQSSLRPPNRLGG